MGRDVIATLKGGTGAWDNYQCMHYKDPLMPTDVWIELAKLAFYTKRGDYKYPRRYHFIAPQGAGIKLSNLLRDPDALRGGLITNWDAYCRAKITTTRPVELEHQTA